MQAILTAEAPAPIGPYNQAIRAGDFLETAQVMANVGAVLAAGGATFAHVVKTTIYLVDMNDFAKVNEVYGASFGPGPAPARSTVAVAALPRGVRVEIEVIAHVA
jgi:2-iminobutanoate/2-iminopropanoate deaminase